MTEIEVLDPATPAGGGPAHRTRNAVGCWPAPRSGCALKRTNSLGSSRSTSAHLPQPRVSVAAWLRVGAGIVRLYARAVDSCQPPINFCHRN
jgi:hypothetical protein